jgi:Raf kinase inhibitor-like YbhB/YbcL family protein
MAQTHPSSSGKAITIQHVRTQQPGRLRLASEALDDAGRIAGMYSGYEDDLSPPLEWTGMPDAETFALVVEDPDAPMDKPVLHWAIWNIPGTLEALPQGVPHGARLDALGGAVQGRNTRGQHGFMGPKPPPGDHAHRYHFQLFALDIALDLKPDTPLEELVNLLKGHAIADAELVGTYEHDADSPRAARTGGHAPGERPLTAGGEAGGLDEDDVDHHAPHDEDGVVRPAGGIGPPRRGGAAPPGSSCRGTTAACDCGWGV